MKMSYNEYEKKIQSLQRLPNLSLSSDYGLTEKNFETIKENPEQYVPYLMYLSTRPWYRLENPEPKEFENKDAIPANNAAEMIDEILYETIELYEESEE